jgi:hypothetical protein
MENTIKMAPPWVTYANVLMAMFEKDPDIKVTYDNENLGVKLYVNGSAKADALVKLLPAEKAFGNVTLKISVVPANDNPDDMVKLFRDAFFGNEAVADIWTAPMEVTQSNPLTYVIFRKEVVQYYNDDLSDAHGNRNTLYQEIAKEIFEDHQGIFFCTDVE